MRQALRALEVNEAEIRARLGEARGDIFLAASMMGISPTELNAYIRASESLQAAALAIDGVKEDPNWRRMSHHQFADRLAQLSMEYRVHGLEVIKEISDVTGWEEDARMARVKLKAAELLRGVEFHVDHNGGSDSVLRELDEAYRAHAPVVSRIRETVREIEFVSQSALPPIAAQRLPDPGDDAIPIEHPEPASRSETTPEHPLKYEGEGWSDEPSDNPGDADGSPES